MTPPSPSAGGGRKKIVLAVVAVLALLIVIGVVFGGDDTETRSGGDADDSPVTDEANGNDDGPDGTDGTTTPRPAGEGWTVLVYLLADTDLEPAAMIDLSEMAELDTGDGSLNVVVLMDRSPEYTDFEVPGVGDFDTAKVLEVHDGEFEEVTDLGELNMGDPQTLADFVNFGVTEYPAAHFGLVLWDHGAGWVGIGPDDSDLDILGVPEISNALEVGLEDTGIPKLDLLGFDACSMATYEVAASLDEEAEFLLASEELEPGHGWDYASFAAAAADGATPTDVGTAIVDGYLAQAEEEAQEAQITLSLLDLGAMPEVEEAVGGFAEGVADDPETYAAALGAQRAQNLSFASNPDPELDLHLTDLGGLVSGAAAIDDSFADDADAITDALDELVVAKTAGPATQDATGLAIYFPAEEEHFIGVYSEIDVDAGWLPLLEAYYEAGEAIPMGDQADFLNPDNVADFRFDDAGLHISGRFDAASGENLVEAKFYYGVRDASDGSLILLGEEPGTLNDDGTASAVFDLTTLKISDGRDEVSAYLAKEVDDDGIVTFEIPLAYFEPGEDEKYENVNLVITIDPDDESVTETYYLFGEEGEVGEFIADPKGIVVPLVLNQFTDGTSEWIPTSRVGLFADTDELSYTFEKLEVGTRLYAELDVTDFGGNKDFVSIEEPIP